MTITKKNGFLFSILICAFLMIFSSCSTSKYPYKKRRKPGKCIECSKWSYIKPQKQFLFSKFKILEATENRKNGSV